MLQFRRHKLSFATDSKEETVSHGFGKLASNK